MFYVPLTHNRVAIKSATCFFNNGHVELVTFDKSLQHLNLGEDK